MTETESIISRYEKEIYDLHQLLEISRSLCSNLEFSNLIESILYNCMGQFRILGAGVFVLNMLDSDAYQLGLNYNGIDVDSNKVYKISVSNPLVKFFEKSSSAVYTLSELHAAAPKGSDLSALESLRPTLIIPLLQKDQLKGILFFGDRIALEEEAYSDYEKKCISVIASLAAVAITNASLVERSSTDMMTHLKLKHYFFNMLSDKLRKAKKEGGDLSVIMFDIDFFKKFNDTYGHACGDYVLKTVAHMIKSKIRGKDLAARYGGEEFTVLLNGANKGSAMTIAERIRSGIERFDFCYESQHMNVTISGGVATYSAKENPVQSPKLLVEQADRALYVSKRAGRNRITFARADILEENEPAQ